MATCDNDKLNLIIEDLLIQLQEEKPILSYLLTLPNNKISLSIKSFTIGRIMNENPSTNLTTIGADINNLKACTKIENILNCDIMLLNLMIYAYAYGAIIFYGIKPFVSNLNNQVANIPNQNNLTDLNKHIYDYFVNKDNLEDVINRMSVDDSYFETVFLTDYSPANSHKKKGVKINKQVYNYTLNLSESNVLKIVNFQKLLKSMIDKYPKLNYQQKIKLQLLLYDNILNGDFGIDSIYQFDFLKQIFHDMVNYKCVTKNIKDVFGLNILEYLKKLLNDFEQAPDDQNKERIFNDINKIIKKSIYFTIINNVAKFEEYTGGPPDELNRQINITSFTDFNIQGNVDKIPNVLAFINYKLGLKGGYNNKNGNIDYHLCKCNFKQSFKKVSAKSSREAAKMVAMKVLKGNKKSATFSLKRMIGKKEKCYDYKASLDKKGKIVIKNQ